MTYYIRFENNRSLTVCHGPCSFSSSSPFGVTVQNNNYSKSLVVAVSIIGFILGEERIENSTVYHVVGEISDICCIPKSIFFDNGTYQLTPEQFHFTMMSLEFTKVDRC